ncbi:hypothetical protein, partial [Mycobacterium simiae]|uniref:hypothetical protein n=1 Tax=Mycobacterium simiae TaxID=1784 RepID=UPI001CB6B8D6
TRWRAVTRRRAIGRRYTVARRRPVCGRQRAHRVQRLSSAVMGSILSPVGAFLNLGMPTRAEIDASAEKSEKV